jgi:putative endonuclease
MAWVYIVECSDGSFYTGSTTNLEARPWEHNDGRFGANFTRKRRPVKLVYCAQTDRIAVAFAREKQIQGWSRAKTEGHIHGPGACRRAGTEPASAI